jgi:anti-sigma factor RsiW
MNCDDVRNLLDAYLDSELDLVMSLDIERHLPGCPDCSRLLQNRRALRDALRSDALYFQAPATLEQQIRSSIARRERWSDRLRKNPWLGMVAALLVGVIMTAGVFQTQMTSSRYDTLAQDVLASHIRSLMVDHLADVASSDQHTVKPWFDGKLDFAPTVIDLAEQGFPLIGGRLDYVDDHAVTALVYQRQKHVINLFIWPSQTDSGESTLTQQGYHLVNWTQGGATYWAVSDLEMGELQTFARLIENHMTTAS